MQVFLFCSLILLASISTVTSFCTDVSHNECRPGFAQHEFDLPLEVCQSLCRSFHNANNACNFYRHTLGNIGFNCFYYAPKHFSDYYQECGVISAPRNVDETCLNPPEDTCYVTQSSRCNYKGTLLESSVADDQEFCRSLCNTEPNCQRWVFFKESKRCERRNSEEQDCQEVLGPPSYTPTECGVPAPSPQPTTAKPTTAHPTTAKITTTVSADCSEGSGYFPVAENCRNYKMCRSGNPTYSQCDSTSSYYTLFKDGDRTSLECLSDEEVECGTRPICFDDGQCQCQHAKAADPTTVCSGFFGTSIISDPFNCQKKITCQYGEVINREDCPAGKYFEISTKECVSDERVCAIKFRPICDDAGSAQGSGSANQKCRCIDIQAFVF